MGRKKKAKEPPAFVKIEETERLELELLQTKIDHHKTRAEMLRLRRAEVERQLRDQIQAFQAMSRQASDEAKAYERQLKQKLAELAEKYQMDDVSKYALREDGVFVRIEEPAPQS